VSFLLDTDICSKYLRGSSAIESRFLQYGGRLSVSVISVAELLAWAGRAASPKARIDSVRALLQIVEILHVDVAVSERWGAIRAHQLDAGRPSPAMDLLIAATALVHDLTLVTHNTKDYQAIPGVRLTDWLAT
jgi:predicted nucleic acid-binding protein